MDGGTGVVAVPSASAQPAHATSTSAKVADEAATAGAAAECL